MRITKTNAKMRFVDVTALEDSTFSTQDNVSIGNLNIFKTEKAQKDYATLELNQFLLDGSKKLMPNAPNDIAFWSSENSDSDCEIDAEIVVTFTTAHTSDGLTLYFADEYPKKLKITWYSLYGTILGSEVFEPTGLSYHCRKQVNNYGKFKIEFLETELPYRKVKLQYILFGVDLDWVDEFIKTAKIKEDIDPTSQTLSINTATLTIIDKNNEFDITRDVGAWKSIQKNQQIMLYETVDGVKQDMGTYFIDRFTFKENQVSFDMIDAIGLMDKYTFDQGAIYDQKKAGLILEEIFDTAHITNYSISDEVYNTKLNGWLEIQTCREALQMVAIACGAQADTSRSNTVKVYIPDRDMHSIISKDRKFLGTEVSLSDYYSGIRIKYCTYKRTYTNQVYLGQLDAGTHKIIFNKPVDPTTIYMEDAGGIIYPEEEDESDIDTEETGDPLPITEKKTNYVVFTLTEDKSVSIEAKEYDITECYHTKEKSVEAGETKTIKQVGTLTLRNSDGLEPLATRLLNYYTLRKRIKTKFLMENEIVGNWAGIMCDNSMAVGFFESNEIDLTGGFISISECVGYSKEVVNHYYAGNEIYAGSEGII